MEDRNTKNSTTLHAKRKAYSEQYYNDISELLELNFIRKILLSADLKFIESRINRNSPTLEENKHATQITAQLIARDYNFEEAYERNIYGA